MTENTIPNENLRTYMDAEFLAGSIADQDTTVPGMVRALDGGAFTFLVATGYDDRRHVIRVTVAPATMAEWDAEDHTDPGPACPVEESPVSPDGRCPYGHGPEVTRSAARPGPAEIGAAVAAIAASLAGDGEAAKVCRNCGGGDGNPADVGGHRSWCGTAPGKLRERTTPSS
jgi:hypothetical protein